MVLRDREDRRVVFLLPARDQPGFGFAAQHHERRRAHGIDEVAGLLGQERDIALIGGHCRLELVSAAAAKIEKQRNEPDAGWKQADDLLGDARAHGRIDHPDDSTPAGKRHVTSRQDDLFLEHSVPRAWSSWSIVGRAVFYIRVAGMIKLAWQ